MKKNSEQPNERIKYLEKENERLSKEMELIKKKQIKLEVLNNLAYGVIDSSDEKIKGTRLGRGGGRRSIIEEEGLKDKKKEEQMIDLIPLPIVIVDAKTQEIYAHNKCLEQYAKCSIEDGSKMEMYYADGDVDKRRFSRAYNEQGHVDSMEVLMKRAGTGEEVWTLLCAYPITYKDKNCMISVFLDINNTKIDQNKLLRAKIEADSANQAKSLFLANMSHEIRTPINAIIGLNHLLINTSLDKKQYDYVSKVIEASKNLVIIINDILDFSKMEAGRLKLEIIEFNLNTVLDNLRVILMVKVENKKNPLKVKLEVDDDVPKILEGDPTRLGQVLVNLTTNAIKFTEKGAILIQISVIKKEVKFVELRFTVSDTGIGIAEDQLDLLFHIFQQADLSTTRRYGGTGLGLVISKNIVELMNGKISVKSEEGIGSIFEFSAIFKYKESVEEDNREISLSNKLKKFKGTRILVVEDNELNQQVVGELLIEEGFKIIIAENGEEAINIIDNMKGQIGLVLMDIQMPIMDGYTAISIIRKNHDYDALPIIAMTAEVMFAAKERVIKIGANDYLIKPIEIEKFYEKLYYWLEH